MKHRWKVFTSCLSYLMFVSTEGGMPLGLETSDTHLLLYAFNSILYCKVFDFKIYFVYLNSSFLKK